MVCKPRTLREALNDSVSTSRSGSGDRETRSIAVLVTSELRCLEAVLEAWASGDPGADIEVVADRGAGTGADD